jgi:hypothetical protein
MIVSSDFIKHYAKHGKLMKSAKKFWKMQVTKLTQLKHEENRKLSTYYP